MKKALTKKGVYFEIRELIASARQRVAVLVNTELIMLYWKIGRRIKAEVLGNARADYGKRVVEELSVRLCAEFGPGWSVKQLRHCLRAAETFGGEQIVSAVQRQLSWSHIKMLIYMDDSLKREFYMEMCALEHWSTRTLSNRINAMMYERTAIAQKPDVVIDLKIDTFKAEYKGQMELYLRWLEKNEMMKGEKKPIGLVLCAGKNEEHVQLLKLDKSNIRVASYMTELPPREVLEEKFRLAIETARRRIAFADDRTSESKRLKN